MYTPSRIRATLGCRYGGLQSVGEVPEQRARARRALAGGRARSVRQAPGERRLELLAGERVGREAQGPPDRLGLLAQLRAAANRIDGECRNAVLEGEHEPVQPRGHD